MSEFEQDPSANTGRFRAFAERRDEDTRPRRSPVSPAVLIAAVVAVIAVVIIIVAVA
jgi:hypothetical protein